MRLAGLLILGISMGLLMHGEYAIASIGFMAGGSLLVIRRK